MSAAGADNLNDNNNANNIIFTIKDTKLYVPIVTLSARNNQKLSKLLSKGFERSVYWNEHIANFRSILTEVFDAKSVLKDFAKLMEAFNFIKNRHGYKCLPGKFAKHLRTHVLEKSVNDWMVSSVTLIKYSLSG